MNRYVVALLRHTRGNRHPGARCEPAVGNRAPAPREGARPRGAEAVTSCRRTFASPRHPCSATGSCWRRRRGRPVSAPRTSCARRSTAPPYPCETEKLLVHRARALRPRGLVGLRVDAAHGRGPRVRTRRSPGARWARAVRGSLEVERRLLPGDRIEGGDVAIEVRVRHRRRALGGSITVRQPLGAAVRESRVPGARSVVVFPAVPRGRHRLGLSTPRSSIRSGSSGSSTASTRKRTCSYGPASPC